MGARAGRVYQGLVVRRSRSWSWRRLRRSIARSPAPTGSHRPTMVSRRRAGLRRPPQGASERRPRSSVDARAGSPGGGASGAGPGRRGSAGRRAGRSRASRGWRRAWMELADDLLEAADPCLDLAEHGPRRGVEAQVDRAPVEAGDRRLDRPPPAPVDQRENRLDDSSLGGITDQWSRVRVGAHAQVGPEHRRNAEPDLQADLRIARAPGG